MLAQLKLLVQNQTPLNQIPSNFPGETIPTVNAVNTLMSVNPRKYKVVSKTTALPELFFLRFIESQNPQTPKLRLFINLLNVKTRILHQKAMP